MPDEPSEMPLLEAFDHWLVEASPSDFEDFISQAPQRLRHMTPELLREHKAWVDARLTAEPESRVFGGEPHDIRVGYWGRIADRFQAEINWRNAQTTQIASARDKKALRPGAQKDHTVAARRVIVRQNLDVSDREVCEILDRERISLPKDWPDDGYKTWLAAWDERKERIQVIFSKDRKSD
jgi:hypothetical protein